MARACSGLMPGSSMSSSRLARLIRTLTVIRAPPPTGSNSASSLVKGLARRGVGERAGHGGVGARGQVRRGLPWLEGGIRMDRSVVRDPEDRKSTRLNSSHSQISYAVFCLEKKKHTAATHHH